MLNVIRELLASKKFVAALLAVVVALLVRKLVPGITLAELTAIVSPLMAYVAAQGLADIGKERVQEEVTWMRERDGNKPAGGAP